MTKPVSIGGDGRAYQIRAERSDGFTAAKRRLFLDTLAETCNVVASARVAGIAKKTVYAARRRDPEFAAAWREALSIGYDRLEERLLRAAGAGVWEGPPGEPGDGDRETPLDVRVAMDLLRHHHGIARGEGKPGLGRRVGPATREQAEAALLAKLRQVERRLKARTGE